MGVRAERKDRAQARSTRVTLRLNESELSEVDDVARRLGLTRSAVLRGSVGDLAASHIPARRATTMDDEAIEELKQLRKELRRIGVNVNQMARRANSARFGTGTRDDLRAVTDALGMCDGHMLELLGRLT